MIELGKGLEKIIPPRFAYITYDIYHQRKFGDHGGNCISEAIEVGCLCEEWKKLPGLCWASYKECLIMYMRHNDRYDTFL